jgi:hypothetical protein
MLGEIIPATRDHAISMAPRVRAVEVQELTDATGLDIEAALLRELDHSATSWAWIVDGEVACLFGVVLGPSLMEFAAYPWMISTHLVEKHASAFARACRRLLPELLERHGRLSGMVDVRHTLSVRWLWWLGADIGEAQPWGVAGTLFHPFTIGG